MPIYNSINQKKDLRTFLIPVRLILIQSPYHMQNCAMVKTDCIFSENKVKYAM